jgi:hypothetical protein
MQAVSKHIRSIIVEFDLFAHSRAFETILEPADKRAGPLPVKELLAASKLLSYQSAFMIPPKNYSHWIGATLSTPVRRAARRLLARAVRFPEVVKEQTLHTRHPCTRKRKLPSVDDVSVKRQRVDLHDVVRIEPPKGSGTMEYLYYHKTSPIEFGVALAPGISITTLKDLFEVWDCLFEMPEVVIAIVKRISRQLRFLKLIIRRAICSIHAKGYAVPYSDMLFMTRQTPIAKQVALMAVQESLRFPTLVDIPQLLIYLVQQNNTEGVRTILNTFQPPHSARHLAVAEHHSPYYTHRNYGNLTMMAIRYENSELAELLASYGAHWDFEQILNLVKDPHATDEQCDAALSFLSQRIDLGNNQTFLCRIFLPWYRKFMIGELTEEQSDRLQLVLRYVGGAHLMNPKFPKAYQVVHPEEIKSDI